MAHEWEILSSGWHCRRCGCEGGMGTVPSYAGLIGCDMTFGVSAGTPCPSCAALRAEVGRLKAELAVATSPEASEAIAQRVYEEIVPKVDPLRARQVEGLLKEGDAAREALAKATALLGKRVRPIIVDTIGYRRNWCMGDPFGAQVALLELDALLAAPAPAKEEA